VKLKVMWRMGCNHFRQGQGRAQKSKRLGSPEGPAEAVRVMETALSTARRFPHSRCLHDPARLKRKGLESWLVETWEIAAKAT
jgi:hypothetical protein